MKKALRVVSIVLLYAYTTTIAYAATSACDAYRQDIVTMQEAARNAEMNRNRDVFEQVKTVSGNVTSMCLNAISSMDIRALGGLSGPIVQAANQLCAQAAAATQRISSVANGDIMGIINQASGGKLAEYQQQVYNAEQTINRVGGLASTISNIPGTLSNIGAATPGFNGAIQPTPIYQTPGFNSGVAPVQGVTQGVNSVTGAAQDVWTKMSNLLR